MTRYEIVGFAAETGSAASMAPRSAVSVGDYIRNLDTSEITQVMSQEQVFQIHPDLWSDWLWRDE